MAWISAASSSPALVTREADTPWARASPQKSIWGSSVPGSWSSRKCWPNSCSAAYRPLRMMMNAMGNFSCAADHKP